MLLKCIQSIVHSIESYRGSVEFELIVSNDGESFALSEEMLSNVTCKLIDGPKAGPAANRNQAAKCSTGEWLLFIDDDCIVKEQLIRAYSAAIEQSNGIEVFEGGVQADRAKERLDEEAPLNDKGGLLWSCNFCIKSGLFKSIGGFDENFTVAAMEDVDLRVRLQELGKTIIFLPDALVVHPWRIAKGYSFLQDHFRATLYFLKKHEEMRSEINALAYFRASIYILKDVITNGYKYRYRGFLNVLTRLGFNLLCIPKLVFSR